MERINIKQEVISISDDDEINIKKEPTVRYPQPISKSGLNGINYGIYHISPVAVFEIKDCL